MMLVSNGLTIVDDGGCAPRRGPGGGSFCRPASFRIPMQKAVRTGLHDAARAWPEAVPSGQRQQAFEWQAFRLVPNVILGATATWAASAGIEWSHRLAAIPWVIAILFVGLPHGAADFATSRRVFRSRALLRTWAAYLTSMAAALAAFIWSPWCVIGGFVALAAWHFGSCHTDDAGGHGPSAAARHAAGWARGAIVLAVPLWAWPAETASILRDLLALTHGPKAGSIPPTAVAMVGIGLGTTACLLLLAELVQRVRRARRGAAIGPLPLELITIAALGWFADPLFSVGCYFLVWHGWRQMRPLAGVLGAAPPRSWRSLADGIVRIHVAALPLLIPTWGVLAGLWWVLSPEQSWRDIALLSIVAYMVVTPAHELLDASMRRASGTADVVMKTS